MRQQEAKRRFWSDLVARFEGAGKSRREFADEAGVGLAIFPVLALQATGVCVRVT